MALKAQQVEFLLSENPDLASGTATFYTAGSSHADADKKTIWQDRNKTTPAANPVALDAVKGTATVFADGVYDVVLKNAAGVTTSTLTNIEIASKTSSSSYSVSSDFDGSLSDAVASPLTAGKRIIVDAVIDVGSLTVASDREIEVSRSGKIRYSGVVAINGQFTAGDFYCLQKVGSGSLTLATGATAKLVWFWPGSGEIGTATNLALNAATCVVFPAISSLQTDPSVAVIRVPSNRILDLNGCTLTRIGSNTTSRMIENYTYGGTTDADITITNGKLIGTGATAGLSDQGHAIGCYGVTRLRLVNINTDNTNGDGIAWRECPDIVLRDIQIGTFGRNGMSPTSGYGSFENVTVVGPAIPGANPGSFIDIENDAADETTDYSFYNVKSPAITFADLYTAASGTFAHRARFANCKFGPGFKALRVISVNPTTAADFVIGGSNVIKGSGSSGPALEIDNVSGVMVVSPILDVTASTGTAANINITNTVSGLTVINPKMVGGGYGVQAYATARLNNSTFTGNLGNVYFAGADNIFKSAVISALTINEATSTGNLFDVATTITTVTVGSGATIASNNFGAMPRGVNAPVFYSKEAAVPDGTTYDMTIPIPSTVGPGNGRLLFLLAGYTHKGNVLHWAQLVATIRSGDTTQASANTISTQGAAGMSIVITAVTQTSITLRLTYEFMGIFSVTVLG